MSKIKVVNLIPTYNEAENITAVLSGLDAIAKANHKYQWQTLVVDDNSPDATAKHVSTFSAHHMQIILLTGTKNGLGTAMRKGLDYAITKLHADIIITNEADLAYDYQAIPQSLKLLETGYDAVIGSRHVPQGQVFGWSFSRKLNHFIANTIFATWVAGTHEIKDHNGAFRTIKVKGILDQINWQSLPTRGFAFFNYWSFLLTQLTNLIYELPITYHFRTRGESKVSFNSKYLRTYLKDIIEYIYLCFVIRATRTKQIRPPELKL